MANNGYTNTVTGGASQTAKSPNTMSSNDVALHVDDHQSETTATSRAEVRFRVQHDLPRQKSLTVWNPGFNPAIPRTAISPTTAILTMSALCSTCSYLNAVLEAIGCRQK